MTTLTVGTVDLRQALTSVVAHACKPKDEIPDLTRVRLTVGTRHVFVSASDRFTMGLAVVSVWDHYGDDTEIVEVAPDDVAKILRVFPVPGKDGGDEGPQYMLRVEVDDTKVTLTDISGLGIVGRKLEVPRLETAVTLDSVPRLFEQAHAGQVVLLDAATQTIVSGANLARFKVACGQYSETLTLETRSSGKRKAVILVRIGESFLGLIVPRSQLQGDMEQAQEWAEGWTARLPEIAVVGGEQQ